jgi:hypothetical protein
MSFAMALAPIRELGVEIERSWAAAAFDLAAFPGICGEHLEAAKLHAVIDPAEIVDDVFRADLPPQFDPDATFGQPPVTLYRTDRFFIDALFWVDGTTTIHDHSFSGAFQVLSGQSIETTFSFSESRAFARQVLFGDLRVNQSDLRATGAVRAVPAGPAYIHSLFHLARPSVSLVVRTYKDPDPGRQFAYSPTGVAFDSQTKDQRRDRIVQTVEMLRKTEHPEFEGRVGALIAATDLPTDLSTAFAILRACARSADASTTERLLARIEDPEVNRRLRDWFVERRRTDFLIGRRNQVHKPELRFLLAVLLNARRRVDALALAARFEPAVAPARQIAAWLRELAGVTIRLRIGDEPFEPNILGLPPFGPGCEEGLAGFLAGDGAPTDADVVAFMARLRALPALRPLFSDDEHDG